jgi:hypothetical protein
MGHFIPFRDKFPNVKYQREMMLSCKLVYNSVFDFRSFSCLCYVGALFSLTKRLLRFDSTTISDNRQFSKDRRYGILFRLEINFQM